MISPAKSHPEIQESIFSTVRDVEVMCPGVMLLDDKARPWLFGRKAN